MPSLTLIRGLPGSGKSTLAKRFTNHAHYEADMFFVDHTGQYEFVQEQVAKAHKWCQFQTELALEHGLDVVVSNTFTCLWEMNAYRKLAKKFCAPVHVIQTHGAWPSVHNVPQLVIQGMRDRWEHLE